MFICMNVNYILVLYVLIRTGRNKYGRVQSTAYANIVDKIEDEKILESTASCEAATVTRIIHIVTCSYTIVIVY